MISMNGYKVIYKDEVFNCLDLDFLEFDPYTESMPTTGERLPTFLTVAIINKDNLIVSIRDEAKKFQFIREVRS